MAAATVSETGQADQTLCTTTTYYIFKGLYIQETSFQHPLVVIYFTNIAASMIVKDQYYHIIPRKPVFSIRALGQLLQSLHTASGAVATEHAFVLSNTPGHNGAILVGHFCKLIYHTHVVVGRYKVFPESLTYIRIYFFLVYLTGIKILF